MIKTDRCFTGEVSGRDNTEQEIQAVAERILRLTALRLRDLRNVQ